MINDESKLCVCLKDKVFSDEPEPHGFTAKKGRLYYYYQHSRDTIGVYGKNNLQVFGIKPSEFKKHFEEKK